MTQKAPFIVNEQQVKALLPELNVRALMSSLFRDLGNNLAVQPPQTLTLFPDNKGDFITYQGALAEEKVFGAKLSPYLITGDKPIITAWTSLMSMETGQPLLLCDSGLLTVERTAGTTALAVDCLAAPESKNLAVIGTGNVGLAHLRHVLPLRDWESIGVFAPELTKNQQRMADIESIDSRVQIAASVQEAALGADVVMLCTSSGSPVISEQDIKATALVTSISTNVANAHEVPPSLLGKADVYCDYKKTTPASAGEMVLAKEQYGWDASAIKGDLADLVNEKCPRPDYDKPVFFRSIGLGLEDVAIAYGIWKLVSQN
ncbi:ornithine cyclodeaminase family protein [Spongorhabdus nitratireducens]